MGKLKSIFQLPADPVNPPMYADLVLDMGTEEIRVDVDQPGWLEEIQPLYKEATRIGLALKNKPPAVWLKGDGRVWYFSRVIGKIGPSGHRRIRVAGITNSTAAAWLHRDGLVEVGPEPSWRE